MNGMNYRAYNRTGTGFTLTDPCMIFERNRAWRVPEFSPPIHRVDAANWWKRRLWQRQVTQCYLLVFCVQNVLLFTRHPPFEKKDISDGLVIVWVAAFECTCVSISLPRMHVVESKYTGSLYYLQISSRKSSKRKHHAEAPIHTIPYPSNSPNIWSLKQGDTHVIKDGQSSVDTVYQRVDVVNCQFTVIHMFMQLQYTHDFGKTNYRNDMPKHTVAWCTLLLHKVNRLD